MLAWRVLQFAVWGVELAMVTSIIVVPPVGVIFAASICYVFRLPHLFGFNPLHDAMTRESPPSSTSRAECTS